MAPLIAKRVDYSSAPEDTGLIENLNDLDADVIFIKNIDNVVPDARARRHA